MSDPIWNKTVDRVGPKIAPVLERAAENESLARLHTRVRAKEQR